MDEKKTEEKKPQEGEEKTDEHSDVGKPSEQEEAIVTKAKSVAETQKEVEELKALNLAKEEKLLERKEALNALGGGSEAGQESRNPEISEEQKATNAKIKEVGDATGAKWANDMDKKDGA